MNYNLFKLMFGSEGVAKLYEQYRLQFLTVEAFARHYGLPVIQAKLIIKTGERIPRGEEKA
ncbi:MAG: hypothetical protein KAT00_15155 [Planctomycetes bacterium]|nr:hypothetical protein [Planctomycetota bacterium]